MEIVLITGGNGMLQDVLDFLTSSAGALQWKSQDQRMDRNAYIDRIYMNLQ